MGRHATIWSLPTRPGHRIPARISLRGWHPLNLNFFLTILDPKNGGVSILCGKKRPIHIARELTKRYEESIGKTINEALEYFIINKPKGEFTIVLGGKQNRPRNKTSESEALNKLNSFIKQGEKSNLAARKIAEETGYEKKWLYSKLHKGLDK